MMKPSTTDHLMAALDECSAAMNDIESYAQQGLIAEAPALMQAIIGRAQEARLHVRDIIENMVEE